MRKRFSIWVVPGILLAGILVPFVLWGDAFGEFLSWEGTLALMERHRLWAWALGVGLLVADLVLPIPGTVVMSALGWMYGPWLGGVAASLGSFLSAYAAYGLSRAVGRPLAVRLAGEENLRAASVWFMRNCGPAVALSRCLPVLNEAVACLAGLSLYPHREFVAAALAGSVSVGFAFAWIGHLGREHSSVALLLSVVLPVVLWWIYRRIARRSAH